MALTGWSTSNYLSRAAGVWPGARPFGISAWLRLCTAGITIAVGTSGGDNHRRWLFANDGGNASASETNTLSSAIATATASTPSNAWNHLFGSFIADDLRDMYLNGGNKGSNATSRAVNDPNLTTLGIRPSLTDPLNSTAGLAECSIWDLAGLTSGDRDSLAAMLAAGDNPVAIDQGAGVGAGKLVAYWRLLDSSDILDLSGNGHDLSITGSLSDFGNHPPVDSLASNTDIIVPTAIRIPI